MPLQSDRAKAFILKEAESVRCDLLVQAFGVEFYVAGLKAEGEKLLSLLVKFNKI